jgi:hypothetical protein
VVAPQHLRLAVRVRPAVAWDARPLSRSYPARFPRELLGRDATQLPGVTAWHARSQATRTLPCNARLSAVTRATRAARPPHGEATAAFAKARRKRRALHQPLIARMVQP